MSGAVRGSWGWRGPGVDGTGLVPGASHEAGGPAYGVTALFRAHHAELVRLAVLMTGDRASAEDIVQDVFARLCARDYLPEPGGALAYVGAAVLNGCRTALRRRAVARRFGGARDALAVDVTQRSAESEALLAEDRRQVLAALAGLSRRRREVLVLRYWLGLPEAEIAAVLGISPGTVKFNRRAGHRRPGAPARGVSMSRTEDRLTDALAAAARAVPEETLRPLAVPRPRTGHRGWVPWLAPLAAAAGIALVVGLATVLSGRTPGPPPAGVAGSGPRYYVVDGLPGGAGRALHRYRVDHRHGPGPYRAAGQGTSKRRVRTTGMFFVGLPRPSQESMYRFRLTRSGQVTGFAAVQGAHWPTVLTRRHGRIARRVAGRRLLRLA